MAYTTPPTFADDTILTAANLNILSDDVEHLYGLISGVNIPFSSQTITASGESRRWIFRRQARYLHYKIRNITNDTDELHINVNGNDEYDDVTNRSGAYTWEGYIDLTGITAVPAVGAFYEVYVDITFDTGPNDLRVDYLLESDSTTL